MSRSTHSGPSLQSVSAGDYIDMASADINVPGSGTVALIGEAFADYKFGGMVNERALLAHWQRGVENILLALPKIEVHARGTAVLHEMLGELWRGVMPGSVNSRNVQAVRANFDELVGPCREECGAPEFSEDLDVERIVLRNMALRLAHFHEFVEPRAPEINWLNVQRSCLKILSAAAIALGTAPAIQSVLDDAAHPLFDHTLSMVKEIAEHTRHLEGKGIKDSDLTPLQQPTVKLRLALVGHLTRSFVARQSLENSGVILACMRQFGVDAAPAFDYLLSGVEIDRASAVKVLHHSIGLRGGSHSNASLI